MPGFFARGPLRLYTDAMLPFRRLRAVALAALLILPLAVTSCASIQEVAVDPLGPTPDDFSIDMTILTGRRHDEGAPAHLRQSRLVLFADGSLHYGIDTSRRSPGGAGGRGAEWLPPRVRTLDRAGVASLWALAQQIGFADASRADENINFSLIQPQRGDVVYLVMFTGGGNRWSFIRTSPLEQPADEAMARLARELAELAWSAAPTEPRAFVLPDRRDYGPDPYERYRR